MRRTPRHPPPHVLTLDGLCAGGMPLEPQRALLRLANMPVTGPILTRLMRNDRLKGMDIVAQ